MEFNKKSLKSIFVILTGCILVYWVLLETEKVKAIYDVFMGVVSPFLIGAGIAFIANVPMRAIEKRLGGIKNEKFRRTTALMLTMLAIIIVISVVFWLLIPQVSATAQSFAAKLPAFFAKIEKAVVGFLNENPKLMEWIYQNTDFENMDMSSLIQKAVDMVGTSVSTILSGAVTAIGGLTSGIVNAVISFVFALYCLGRKEILARQGRMLAYSFLPEHAADQTIRILRLTNSTFSNFLSGQCLEVVILGIMFAVAMVIFGMPYVPLVSVLVAVTAFIPLVGAFVGCILGAFFILVDNPMQAVWFVVMFLVIQQIEGNVIYPRVVGNSIGLPGMWVLLAVSVGGELMGVAGMFLMIPLASVVYTLAREATHSRLQFREIDPEKLRDQPPELQSKIRERIKKKREKRAKNQAEEKED